MSLILLPRKNDPQDATAAQHKFKAAIDDPYSALLVVYGEGPDIDRMVEVGCAAASAKAAFRRLVWVRNPDVLSAEQKKKYMPKNYPGSPVVSIGLDNKRAKELTTSKAQVTLYVEEAFLEAESQGDD